jgi:hypothetical protein
MTFKLQRNDLSETFLTRFIASQDIPVHDTAESPFEILDLPLFDRARVALCWAQLFLSCLIMLGLRSI